MEGQNSNVFWKTKLQKFYRSFSFLSEYPNAKASHLSQKRESDKAGFFLSKEKTPGHIKYNNGNKDTAKRN